MTFEKKANFQQIKITYKKLMSFFVEMQCDLGAFVRYCSHGVNSAGAYSAFKCPVNFPLVDKNANHPSKIFGTAAPQISNFFGFLCFLKTFCTLFNKMHFCLSIFSPVLFLIFTDVTQGPQPEG